MASNLRNTTVNSGNTQGRRLLRVVAAGSAACALFLNIVTIIAIAHVRHWRPAKNSTSFAFVPIVASLAWDTMQLVTEEYWQKRPSLQRAGDLLAIVAFAAILITNGVVTVRLDIYAGRHLDKTLLMAYNSFPWIISALTHICLVLYPTEGFKISDMPKLRLRVEWPEPRHVLLSQQDDGEEDVEAQPRKESSESSADGGEAEPLLSST